MSSGNFTPFRPPYTAALGCIGLCALFSCATQSAPSTTDPLRSHAPLTSPIAPTPSLWRIHQTQFKPIDTTDSGASTPDAGTVPNFARDAGAPGPPLSK